MAYANDATAGGSVEEFILGSGDVSGYNGTIIFDVCSVSSMDLKFTFDRDNDTGTKVILIAINGVVVKTIDMNTYGAGDPQIVTYTLDVAGDVNSVPCENNVEIAASSGGAITNEYCKVEITDVT